jgi:hypothetical protein
MFGAEVTEWFGASWRCAFDQRPQVLVFAFVMVVQVSHQKVAELAHGDGIEGGAFHHLNQEGGCAAVHVMDEPRLNNGPRLWYRRHGGESIDQRVLWSI